MTDCRKPEPRKGALFFGPSVWCYSLFVVTMKYGPPSIARKVHFQLGRRHQSFSWTNQSFVPRQMQ